MNKFALICIAAMMAIGSISCTTARTVLAAATLGTSEIVIGTAKLTKEVVDTASDLADVYKSYKGDGSIASYDEIDTF